MALSAVTPTTLPAEFQTKLDQRFLIQPDVEFVFAQWAYSALVASQMSDEDGFDVAVQQLRDGRVTSMGSPSNLAEAYSAGMGGPLLLSRGMVYPDFVKMVQAPQGVTTIKIPRPKFIDGAASESGRRLTPNTRIFGTSSQGLTQEQVDVVIREYGGPGDSNGNVVPLNIAHFSVHRSEHDLLAAMGYELRRDRNKFVDSVVRDMLIAAAGAVTGGTTYGGGLSAASSFTGNDNEPMELDRLIEAAEALRGRKVPGMAGTYGQYVAVLDHHQVAQLKKDQNYQRLAQFFPQYNPLFPGYQATVDNLVICESNNMPRLTSSIGSATTAYQGVIVAPDAIGWASAMGARVIRDRDDDGGRINQFAWHAIEGWRVLDDRFTQLIITD